MQKMYITAKEVADVLDISEGHAYKMVKSLNQELKQMGYITIAGKLPIKYFAEKFYGFQEVM